MPDPLSAMDADLGPPPFDPARLPDEAAAYGLRINSGQRSPAHNAAVGGAARSYHLLGTAYDFVGPQSGMDQFTQYLTKNYGPSLAEVYHGNTGWKNGQAAAPIAKHGGQVHVAWNADDPTIRMDKDLAGPKQSAPVDPLAKMDADLSQAAPQGGTFRPTPGGGTNTIPGGGYTDITGQPPPKPVQSTGGVTMVDEPPMPDHGVQTPEKAAALGRAGGYTAGYQVNVKDLAAGLKAGTMKPEDAVAELRKRQEQTILGESGVSPKEFESIKKRTGAAGVLLPGNDQEELQKIQQAGDQPYLFQAPANTAQNLQYQKRLARYGEMKPDERVAEAIDIAKTRPLTAEERKELGVGDPGLFDKFGTSFMSGVMGTTGKLASGLGAKGFGGKAQDASRVFQNLWGERGQAEKATQMVGGLAPELAGTIALPEGRLAHMAYWGLLSGTKARGEGKSWKQAATDAAEAVVMLEAGKPLGPLRDEVGDAFAAQATKLGSRAALGYASGYALARAQGASKEDAQNQGMQFAAMSALPGKQLKEKALSIKPGETEAPQAQPEPPRGAVDAREAEATRAEQARQAAVQPHEIVQGPEDFERRPPLPGEGTGQGGYGVPRIEPKGVSTKDLGIPTHYEAQRPPSIVQRTEEPGTPMATTDKPHGIYTSPEGVGTHTDLGGETARWRVNQNAKVMTPSAKPIPIRRGAVDSGAGVHAAKDLLGDAQFNALRDMSKGDIVRWASSRYPDTDFSKYYDKQEVLEAIGGMEARKQGYDIIHLPDKDPAFTETVLLTPNAGTRIKPAAQSHVDTLAQGSVNSLSEARQIKFMAEHGGRKPTPDEIANFTHDETLAARQIQQGAVNKWLTPDSSVNKIVIVAGEAGGGKSTAIDAQSRADEPGTKYYETHYENLPEVKRILQEGQRNGKEMEVVNVHREGSPEDVYAKTVKRAEDTGKVVGPEYAADLARSFYGNLGEVADYAKGTGAKVKGVLFKDGETTDIAGKYQYPTKLPADLEDKFRAQVQGSKYERQFLEQGRPGGVQVGPEAQAVRSGGGPLPQDVTQTAKEAPQTTGESREGQTGLVQEPRQLAAGEPERTTGIKNAVTESERAERGLDPIEKEATKALSTSLAEGKTLLAEHTDFRQQVRDWGDKPRTLTDAEEGALLTDRMQLHNQSEDLLKQAKAAIDAKDTDRLNEINAKLQPVQQALLENDAAAKATGTQWGRSGRARQMMMKQDYSLTNNTLKWRAANGGKELTEAQTRQVADLTEKLRAAEARLKEVERAASRQAAQQEVARQARQARRGQRVVARTALDAEYAELSRAFGKATGKLSANPLFDPEPYAIIGKIVKNRAQAGINTAQGMVDAVREAIKDYIDPSVTDREIRDAIGGYGRPPGPTKSDLQQQIAAIKREARQASRQADIKAGQPTGRTPTEAQSQQRNKTYYENRLAELQGKLDRGEYVKAPRRAFQPNPENQRLKAQVGRLQQQIDQGAAKIELANRSKPAKVRDFLVRMRVREAVSGITTMGKVATDNLFWRQIEQHAENVAGAAITKVAPKLAAKAGGEAVPNIGRTEARTFGSQIRGLRDLGKAFTFARQNPQSELQTAHGKINPKDMPPSVLDMAVTLHRTVQTPLEQTAFDAAYGNQMDALRKANPGMDPNDPAIVAQVIPNAFRISQERILNANNALNNKIRNLFVTKGGGGEAVRQIIQPVMKRPLNYLKQVGEYHPATGTAQILWAMRKGIANMDADTAGKVMRIAKRTAGVGAAMTAWGWMRPQDFGGYYQPGEKRKEGELKAGQMRIAGITIPAWLARNPAFEVAQMTATARRLYDYYAEKGRPGVMSGAAAGVRAAAGMAREVPFLEDIGSVANAASEPKGANAGERLERGLGQAARNLVEPPDVQKLASPQGIIPQLADREKTGEPRIRQPRSFGEEMKMGVPGLRQTIPQSIDAKAAKIITDAGLSLPAPVRQVRIAGKTEPLSGKQANDYRDRFFKSSGTAMRQFESSNMFKNLNKAEQAFAVHALMNKIGQREQAASKAQVKPKSLDAIDWKMKAQEPLSELQMDAYFDAIKEFRMKMAKAAGQ